MLTYEEYITCLKVKATTRVTVFWGENTHQSRGRKRKQRKIHKNKRREGKKLENKVHMWSATKTSIARAPLHEI